MRRRRVGRFLAGAWLAFAIGCAGAPDLPTTRELLASAAPTNAPRLVLDGDRVLAIACPIVAEELSPRARTTLTAIAPEGELVFVARERGPRGYGFRVEKRYREPVPHMRSQLIAPDGKVLERAHTLPLSSVPQHVLATALTHGNTVDQAWIVSGPVSEEYWLLTVANRRGQRFVVEVGLDGTFLRLRRRHRAVVDS